VPNHGVKWLTLSFRPDQHVGAYVTSLVFICCAPRRSIIARRAFGLFLEKKKFTEGLSIKYVFEKD
jgi:hypothetical protein